MKTVKTAVAKKPLSWARSRMNEVKNMAKAKERARKRRIFLGGPFSQTQSPVPTWAGRVLGKKRMILITGGRLGPVNEVVAEAMKKGGKNISVILEPWAEKFNPNIKGKARNITPKGNERTGTRPVYQRLGLLHTNKVRAYAFIYPGEKTFSGTMMELQAIVNAYTVESMSKKAWKRPIILLGNEWKRTVEQIQKDYASKWDSLKDYLIVATNEEELKKALEKK
jgi:predicted Rossmann-fold nucleotide-binding protein